MNKLAIIPLLFLTACGEAPVTASVVDAEFYDQLVEQYHEARTKRDYRDAEDVINSALMEFNYGSNGTTESEELLQLPSRID